MESSNTCSTVMVLVTSTLYAFSLHLFLWTNVLFLIPLALFLTSTLNICQEDGDFLLGTEEKVIIYLRIELLSFSDQLSLFQLVLIINEGVVGSFMFAVFTVSVVCCWPLYYFCCRCCMSKMFKEFAK